MLGAVGGYWLAILSDRLKQEMRRYPKQACYWLHGSPVAMTTRFEQKYCIRTNSIDISLNM